MSRIPTRILLLLIILSALIHISFAQVYSGYATLTYYKSYAECCPDEVNYDPDADTTECDVYSACNYTGSFAALPGKQSYDFVKNSSLIAFYQYGDSDFTNFYEYYALKNVTLVKGDVIFDAVIVDTCGDADCGGCCSANSVETGFLVDLEYFTMTRNFDDPNDASGLIHFYIHDDGNNSQNEDDSTLSSGATIVIVTVCIMIAAIATGLCCYHHRKLLSIKLYQKSKSSEKSWKVLATLHDDPLQQEARVSPRKPRSVKRNRRKDTSESVEVTATSFDDSEDIDKNSIALSSVHLPPAPDILPPPPELPPPPPPESFSTTPMYSHIFDIDTEKFSDVNPSLRPPN